MKKIALIGSTGSIGRQVLNVCRRHSDEFKIVSLAAGNNARLFFEQVKEFSPKVGSLANFTGELPNGVKSTEYFFGENAFKNAIIEDADLVVVSLVGFKGIIAVLDAIEKGKNIALANKESLVVGGELVMKIAAEKGVKIVPIDSEHSAIWQCLNFDFNKPFKKIILTASGGAFRDLKKEELNKVTVKEALKHPTWDMGAKITVDCATLVNKAFEVIEAKWLYNASIDNIDVIIHRESIIHSMVEFKDNSVMAQLSYPSMELPITLALNYPERIDAGLSELNFAKLKSLSFEAPDIDRFPCLPLVIEAGKRGGGYPAVANGANEYAVKLFIENKIGFNDIYNSIYGALSSYVESEKPNEFSDLERANFFGEEFVKNKFGE